MDVLENNKEVTEQPERRKDRRFSDIRLLYLPLRLTPLPPFHGTPLQGNLINLSSGGMAFQAGEMMRLATRFTLQLSFPDRSVLEADVEIKRIVPKGKYFWVGLQFLNLPEYMERKVKQMSWDYLGCERRIQEDMDEVCRINCAFYAMCNKKQKWDFERHLSEKTGS